MIISRKKTYGARQHAAATCRGLLSDCPVYLEASGLYLARDAGHPHLEYPFMRSDPKSFRALCDLFIRQLDEQEEPR